MAWEVFTKIVNYMPQGQEFLCLGVVIYVIIVNMHYLFLY